MNFLVRLGVETKLIFWQNSSMEILLELQDLVDQLTITKLQ